MNNEIFEKLLMSIEASNKKTVEEANKNQTKDLKDYINKEIIELRIKFEEELDKKSKEYEAKYVDLKEKYGKLEKELRKNKIIIFGLETPPENLANFVVNTLNSYLQVGLNIGHIDNVYTIGKQTHQKPIVVKLVSYITKQNILKSCKKLKGTSISIAEELSLEERKENKILRQHLKKAREKKLNAFIKQRKLIINGQEYSAQELAEEEEDTDDEYSATASNDQDINAVPTKKTNSAPATPNTNRQVEEERKQEEREQEEVFETQREGDSNKRKIVNVDVPPAKIRSSARLFSIGEKEKEKTVTPISKSKK